MATFYLVSPRGITRHQSEPSARRRALALDRQARRVHGPGAGADCWVVVLADGALRCGGGYGGMVLPGGYLDVGCTQALQRVKNTLQ